MVCHSENRAWDRSGSPEECLHFTEDWDKTGQIEVHPIGAIIENDQVQDVGQDVNGGGIYGELFNHLNFPMVEFPVACSSLAASLPLPSSWSSIKTEIT